jgi:hypothetical protein
MTDMSADDLYAVKHLRLTRIAYIAKILAWIALALQIAWVVVNMVRAAQIYSSQAAPTLFGEGLNFGNVWKYDPLSAALLLAESIGIFFRGVVYWLVLKGVSLGLYMIVETDLNYFERAQGGSDEQ